jgi:hypothetical protein
MVKLTKITTDLHQLGTLVRTENTDFSLYEYKVGRKYEYKDERTDSSPNSIDINHPFTV